MRRWTSNLCIRVVIALSAALLFAGSAPFLRQWPNVGSVICPGV